MIFFILVSQFLLLGKVQVITLSRCGEPRNLLCVTPVLPQLFPGDIHFVIV